MLRVGHTYIQELGLDTIRKLVAFARGSRRVYFYRHVSDLPAGVVPVTRVRAGEESDRQTSGDVFDVGAFKTERGSAGVLIAVQVIARPWRDHVARGHGEDGGGGANRAELSGKAAAMNVAGPAPPVECVVIWIDQFVTLTPASAFGEICAQAGNLSGGEQQMLAIGRALMTEPKLRRNFPSRICKSIHRAFTVE